MRNASSSIVLAISASGRSLIDQATGIPSKQSITGLRYALPAGIRNCVTSVSQSLLGASARKSRATRFPGASPISPLYELYLRLFRA